MKTTPEQRAAFIEHVMRTCPNTIVNGRPVSDWLLDMRDDIDQLEQANHKLNGECGHLEADVRELHAEVDRLKRLRKVTAEWANNTAPPVDGGRSTAISVTTCSCTWESKPPTGPIPEPQESPSEKPHSSSASQSDTNTR